MIARTFAALYPAMAEETDAELPFMNILDFEAFGIGARQTISAELVAYTPYIKNEAMRTEWNDFTERSSDWIVRGHSFYPNFEERVANLEPIYSDIYRLTTEGDRVREISIGPFSPAWQMSPPPTDTEIVNFNYGSNTVFSKLLTYTTESYEGILSEPVDMKAIFGTSVPTSDGPLSLYLEPVFDSFNPLSAAIKGHIVAAIPWVAFFSNVSVCSVLLWVLLYFKEISVLMNMDYFSRFAAPSRGRHGNSCCCPELLSIPHIRD